MTRRTPTLFAALVCACLLAPVPTSALGQDPAADAAQERPRRSVRSGMPLPPDWPRAGGFGPGGQGAERPMIEGLVLEGMIPTSFGRRELTDEDLDRVLVVAREVSPEWATAIAARIEADPAQFKVALRNSGRRLLGLAALKERAPKVYEVKVAELRAQAETERAATALRSADPASADAAREALDETASRQVAATLAARRAELGALEERLKRLREEVDADEARKAELAAEVAERARKRSEEPRREGRRE